MGMKSVIVVDTNVILETHRTGCWRAFSSQYYVETVEKCVEETQTGSQKRNPKRRIDEKALRETLSAVHTVSTKQRIWALDTDKYYSNLDPGEGDLWAHLVSRSDDWAFCGPDIASLKFGIRIGYRDRLVALERKLTDVGIRPSMALGLCNTNSWHNKKIVELALETGNWPP